MTHAFDQDYWDRHRERGWHVTAADITAVLEGATWEIVTAEERSRDAVVRAIRLGQRPTR